MKKITAVILAFALALSFTYMAFADGEEEYDYKKDARLTRIADYENGEFTKTADGEEVLGGYAPAVYQVTTKKMYAYNNVPSTEDEEGKVYKLTIDGTYGSHFEYEGIPVCAFYACSCPSCGKACGGYTVFEIYDCTVKSLRGCCKQCGAKLPNPDELKIYRFITLDMSGRQANADGDQYAEGYEDLFENYDFSKYADDIYGDTEGNWGDGKDRAGYCLTFDYIWTITSVDPVTNEAVAEAIQGNDGTAQKFLTAYDLDAEADFDIMPILYTLISDWESKYQPINDFIVQARFVDVLEKIKAAPYQLLSDFLTLLFTKIL